MINLRRDILFERNKISKEEGIDSKIFSKKSIPRCTEKIRKEYFELLNSFFNEKSIYKLENELGRSKKNQQKEVENILLCFKGIFRNFLKNIKEKYKEKTFWRIKK